MCTLKQTVVVGISGGVDSSVAAHLLKSQGYKVIAVYMKNWEETTSADSPCPYAQDLRDVEAVCQQLDIELYTINFALEYWENVFEYFLSAYRAGLTPNPDILCNKEIKFKAFYDYACTLGADFIATGHYARIVPSPDGWYLAKALDTNKDQSYFLSGINAAVLPKVLFPLAELTKPQVRKIATDLNLPNQAKKDSTGICFIGERNFKSFLSQYIPAQTGQMMTPEGKIIGQHAGTYYYTLGQRKGLQIGGVKGAIEAPWFVVAKDNQRNILFVTQDINHDWQYSTQLTATDINVLSPTPLATEFRAMASFRYRQAPVPVSVTATADGWTVIFDTPQAHVTPGQAVVLYEDALCLGGGTIAKTDSRGGVLMTGKDSYAAALSV